MKFNGFNERPVKFMLKNGLNVELIYAPTLQTYVEYDVPLGSIHTAYKIGNKTHQLKPGIAHFLEHMMYMMKDHDAFEQFHKLGVIANAMTTYRQTTYGVIGHKNMLEATLYLLEMLETTNFTGERVQAEKSIIKEEIAMYDDEVDTIVQKKMFDQLIYEHPIKYEITGRKSDISNISAKDLQRVFDHFYTSDKRQLLILGPIDVEQFKHALLNYESLITKTKHPVILNNDEPKSIKSREEIYHLKINVGVFNMGIKCILDTKEEKVLFKTELYMLFLMRMLYDTSTNFQEQMSALNLMIDGFNFNLILEDETLIFMMDVESDHSFDLKEHVLNQFFSTDNKDLTKEAFIALKKAYLGHFMMALDDIENRLFLYGKYQLNGISLEEAFNLLDGITYQDILDFKASITKDMFSFSHFIKNDQNS